MSNFEPNLQHIYAMTDLTRRLLGCDRVHAAVQVNALADVHAFFDDDRGACAVRNALSLQKFMNA